MNIKKLLGKLSIGHAGTGFTGTGHIVRTGSPEDAYRSGAAEFLRTKIAQTQDVQPDNNKRMMHPVVLVSRFKYPYVKSKTITDDEGNKSRVENGELGWKYTANKDFADQEVAGLYAYKLYLYQDTTTGQDVVLGQRIEDIAPKSQPQPEFDTNAVGVANPDWYEGHKKTRKVKKMKPQASNNALHRYAAGLDGGEELPANDFSVERELDATPEQRYKFKGEITKFTTNPSDPDSEAAKLGATVVPASSLGYRAYEVMPSPVAHDLYVQPSGEDESKIPTWTHPILVPTEESPSAYGTSFRYRFSNGQPVPTLNGIKHVLSELLSIDGEKAPKDPGMNSDFNIYEFMTENNLWEQMDKHGNLPSPVKAQIENAEVEIHSNPELEHFTLGGGSLVNLGGKKNAIMSEENLLARALHYLGNPSIFTYVNTDGTQAFRPKVQDDPNIGPLTKLESQLHAARQAYVSLYEQMKPAERKESEELEKAAKLANHLGIKYVDLMAAKYPSRLREFVLKQPYVGHAPAGDHNKPGGKHESAYALSPESHLSDKGRTLATFESGGGLQKLNSDDRKLYALRKAFERNAENALNNQAKTLHSQKHAKLVDVPSEDGSTYKIPVPRDKDGAWSENAESAIDFIENHWLQNHLLNSEDRNAISELQQKLAAQGHNYGWGQVAAAYLNNQERLKVKKYTQGASLLTSTDHFLVSSPMAFELSSGEDSEDFITIKKYTAQSDTAEKLKAEVLKQNLFSARDIEIAEQLASKAPFEGEDDVLFSLWADGLLRAKRKQAELRADKALATQQAREKSKTENAKGKPNGWPYSLTSKKFDDSERADFAANLEDFVNTLKYQAGAVIEPSRKIVYIKPDGQQVTLPDVLPVELPAGAKMPIAVDKLKKIKDESELAKYGIVRLGNALFNAANAQPITVSEDGDLIIGEQHVPMATLAAMTPKEAVEKFNIFRSPDGTYHHINDRDKITTPITEVIAQGGEKIALPADRLDEHGLNLLVKYTEQTTGQKLEGGQVHAYPSDSDKIKMNHVFTDLINSGYSEENAYAQAKRAVLNDKMNSIAVQCLSGGNAESQHSKAAQIWIPKIIQEIENNGDESVIEMIEDNYGGRDNMMQAAMNGRLEAEDAQQLVNAYNVLTGTTPQQGAYIKPMMQAVLMHGYDKESTPGLPNNKFWHMLMSNAGRRFRDLTLDSESGNDLGAQAMLHLLERPEEPLEGADLNRILPKNALALLGKTLKPNERRIQRINPRFKTGARTAVEEWQAKPLPYLLAEHSEWMSKPHIFSKELLQQAAQLASTNMVAQKREEIFPEAKFADYEATKKLDYAVAMSILLQRQAAQAAKHPQQDIWDIVMNEPGLDPSSKEWRAKHQLAQYEAQVSKTAESLEEQRRLKGILGLNPSLEISSDAPAMPLTPEDADAIIDQSMVHALNADLIKSDPRARVSVLGKANRALSKEANSTKSTHARGVVYPKKSVSQDSIEPLMITDESGKERDVTGYTPEDYEHITGATHYNDDEFLSPETLMTINYNTKNILSGGNDETLLGQFRQKLNKELLSNNQTGLTREARASMMYDAIYQMAIKYKHNLAENQAQLEQIRGTNSRAERRLSKEVEHDTNVLSMLDAYNVFEHLSKMIYYGRQFGEIIDQIESGNDESEQVLIELAKKYDLEALEVWNFITRTTYMDKRNIAKLEAMGLGVNIGEAGAANESRLMQEDRDEVSSMVARKMDKTTRWFESPAAGVPAVGGADVHAKNPESVDQFVNKEIDNAEPSELARFLSRRGIMFATEMGKLDKMAGRQKSAVHDLSGDEAKVKYSHDFTQSKDLSWFVHDWLQDAEFSDAMIEPGHDGLSNVDKAMGDIERLYARPGGIYWNNNPNNSTLLNIAQTNALAYSLFAKYVDKTAAEQPELAKDLDALVQAATSRIASSIDEIHQSIGYDNLDEDIQVKINDAIASAANAANNIGMKNRLIEEYTKTNKETGGRVYEGTNPRHFSTAKSAIALQMANHHVIHEIIKQDPSNQMFVNDGTDFRFPPKEIASYIAYNIGNEIISSIKHLERPGQWELLQLSPMQVATGLQAGEMIDESVINKYINKRLTDYQNLLQSQLRVDQLSQLEDGASTKVDAIISLALRYLDTLVGESMGANGAIDTQNPINETMRKLQSKAQTVTTALQEDMNEKLNNPESNLQEINDEHVLPALTRAKPGAVRNAVANAMRQWGTGESTWPVVMTGVKNHAGTDWRQQKPEESEEDYRQYMQGVAKKKGKSVESLIGYGSKGVDSIDVGALRDRDLSGEIHRALTNQLTHRLNYLRDPNAKNKSYKSAVHESQKAHMDELRARGLYPEYTSSPSSMGSWAHGNIGILNFDPQDETYNRIKQYKVGTRTRTRKPVEQNALVNTPEVQDEPVVASVIQKLVRLAERLDSNHRHADADFVDSLIHKIEVMV